MNSEVAAALAFGILAILLISMAQRRGFFILANQDGLVPVRFIHLIGAFAIYFLTTYLATTFAILFLKKQIMAHFLSYSSWLNFGISFAILTFLIIYLLALPEKVRKGILRYEKHSFKEDLWTAFYAWVLAFPLVLFISQSLELILYKLFNLTKLPDQMAVKFLKSTFDNPVYFILAVISIVIFAPLIEETLFRGFFQTYIRRHLGSKQAILITSVCFALFHYSAGQGLGNISIIIPLFVLSLFLGFVYEKQRSILASMSLHALFNIISVINLYLFGGFTTAI
jgi:hypothetical protein